MMMDRAPPQDSSTAAALLSHHNSSCHFFFTVATANVNLLRRLKLKSTSLFVVFDGSVYVRSVILNGVRPMFDPPSSMEDDSDLGLPVLDPSSSTDNDFDLVQSALDPPTSMDDDSELGSLVPNRPFSMLQRSLRDRGAGAGHWSTGGGLGTRSGVGVLLRRVRSM